MSSCGEVTRFLHCFGPSHVYTIIFTVQTKQTNTSQLGMFCLRSSFLTQARPLSLTENPNPQNKRPLAHSLGMRNKVKWQQGKISNQWILESSDPHQSTVQTQERTGFHNMLLSQPRAHRHAGLRLHISLLHSAGASYCGKNAHQLQEKLPSHLPKDRATGLSFSL